MKKAVFVFLGFGLLTGCAGDLSKGGQSVYLTPSHSAHLSNCDLIGQVRVETNLNGFWDIDEAKKQMKVDLRNETALRYPNADTVAYSDLEVNKWGGTAETMGSAFKCFNNN